MKFDDAFSIGMKLLSSLPYDERDAILDTILHIKNIAGDSIPVLFVMLTVLIDEYPISFRRISQRLEEDQ